MRSARRDGERGRDARTQRSPRAELRVQLGKPQVVAGRETEGPQGSVLARNNLGARVGPLGLLQIHARESHVEEMHLAVHTAYRPRLVNDNVRVVHAPGASGLVEPAKRKPQTMGLCKRSVLGHQSPRQRLGLTRGLLARRAHESKALGEEKHRRTLLHRLAHKRSTNRKIRGLVAGRRHLRHGNRHASCPACHKLRSSAFCPRRIVAGS
eukprot:Amastigsp_a924_16.p2 type:complete len:210 gc:universal Amastigsp_a924_16:651-22(-)